MTEVLFAPADAAAAHATVGAAVARTYDAFDLPSRLPAGALAAVKLHFGEPGRRAPVPPGWLQPVLDRLREAGTQPFLTDTCTLYRGGRSHAAAHLRTAAARGYTLEQTGVPVVIADGLMGESGVAVPIAGRHFDRVWIAGAAARAGAILNVAHFTGHMGTGFGAVIKNLGMGLASRAGKLQQHAGAAPSVDPERCGGCGACLALCPEGAIGIEGKRAAIDPARCAACGQCVSACWLEAIRADYGAHTRVLQERVAEYALGAVSGKEERVAHLSLVLQVTANCDCLGRDEAPLFPDLGVLGGWDPVAVDQAACDLIAERTGRPIGDWAGHGLDPRWQLAHGEAIGLGRRSYRLRPLATVAGD